MNVDRRSWKEQALRLPSSTHGDAGLAVCLFVLCLSVVQETSPKVVICPRPPSRHITCAGARMGLGSRGGALRALS